MRSNQQRKMSFLIQSFEAGRKAFDFEKTGQLNKANVMYTKAANSLNWAIALEFNQRKRNLLLKVYERFSTTLHAPTPFNISPPPVGHQHHIPPSNVNNLLHGSSNSFGNGNNNDFSNQTRDNRGSDMKDEVYPPPPPPRRSSGSKGSYDGFGGPSDRDSKLFFGGGINNTNNFNNKDKGMFQAEDLNERDEDEDDDMEDEDEDDDLFPPGYNKKRKSSRPKSNSNNNNNNDDEDENVLDMKRLIMGKPDTRFKDVIGLETAVQSLRDAVILPNQYPEWFKGNRQPWRAILLFGPPGTGKTMLARALAGESGCTFLCVTAADLLSKWFGQSEKAIRELFRVAKERAPSVLFIDEIDSFMGERSDGDSTVISRRITNEFLTQMQGLSNDDINDKERRVMVLGTTNIPWKLDRAIRRRFQKRIYIPLPNQQARMKIIQNNIKETPNNLTDQDFLECAEKTDGYSCSDIVGVVQHALMKPIHRIQNASFFKLNTETDKWEISTEGENGGKKMRFFEIQMNDMKTPLVTREDMFNSIDEFNPSIQKDELVRHEEFKGKFGN